jgi:hypothetical protein
VRVRGGGLVAAWVLVSAAHLAYAQVPAVQLLEHGEFVSSNAGLPPPDDADWRPVTLPDNWYLSRPGDTQVGWYRLAFDLTPEQARIPYGMYLPRNSARR